MTVCVLSTDFLDDAKGTKPSYVLAAEGMRAGSTIVASTDGGVDIRPGNAMPLKEIPVGTNVHNIELRPGQGGKMVKILDRGGLAQGDENVIHPCGPG